MFGFNPEGPLGWSLVRLATGISLVAILVPLVFAYPHFDAFLELPLMGSALLLVSGLAAPASRLFLLFIKDVDKALEALDEKLLRPKMLHTLRRYLTSRYFWAGFFSVFTFDPTGAAQRSILHDAFNRPKR